MALAIETRIARLLDRMEVEDLGEEEIAKIKEQVKYLQSLK